MLQDKKARKLTKKRVSELLNCLYSKLIYCSLERFFVPNANWRNCLRLFKRAGGQVISSM